MSAVQLHVPKLSRFRMLDTGDTILKLDMVGGPGYSLDILNNLKNFARVYHIKIYICAFLVGLFACLY